MKPEVIMLMESSLDGKLHPSRWTASPDGERRNWSTMYERVHESLAGDAWIVGRVTMQEMSKATAHPPADVRDVARPLHVAMRGAKSHAVVLDPSGRVHFAGGAVGGDHAIALLGRDVADAHLAELKADGVSYIVAAGAEIDLAAMLESLNRAFGIKRLLLEGGGAINGSFLAAGLVDEVNILVGPAFDGDVGQQGVVAYPGGLAGRCALSFRAATPVEFGMVHLRYAVSRPGAH
ncbi:MAG TPA: RibD family protein [Candidatus Binatia bacterium]|nr:RibD family protein [Candidatus Binatia bacterium]